MPETTRLGDPTNKGLAKKTLERVLENVQAAQPRNEFTVKDYVEPVERFHNEWLKLYNSFIKNPAEYISDLSLPERHGFKVAVRLPGEGKKFDAGRVSRLTWEEVDKPWTGVPFSPSHGEALDAAQTLARAALPFYNGVKLWHLFFGETQTAPAADAFAFTVENDEKKIQEITWQSKPFYELNDRRRFRFSKDPQAYIRCFFHLVRGKLGERFTILETERDLSDHVAWLDDHSAKSIETWKAKVKEKIKPLERKPVNPNGEAVFSATILFNNGLFQSDVVLDPTGLLRLDSEESQLSDLPVQSRNVGDRSLKVTPHRLERCLIRHRRVDIVTAKHPIVFSASLRVSASRNKSEIGR